MIFLVHTIEHLLLPKFMINLNLTSKYMKHVQKVSTGLLHHYSSWFIHFLEAPLQLNQSVFISLFWSYKMFNLVQDPTNCELRSLIRFKNTQNVWPVEINPQICETWRKCIGWENMWGNSLKVERMCMMRQLSIINEDLSGPCLVYDFFTF